MRIVFSRKGFDSSAGGRPSPIVDGRPLSLPIPARDRSHTTYAQRGLGAIVERATGGRIGADALCHDDPMFSASHCWFGQSGAAQGHLARHGVDIGDVFLFFGLFADPSSGERHHRIFGYMQVVCFGPPESVCRAANWAEPPCPHPHRIGAWDGNNTLYHGPGRQARCATAGLRLTRPGGPLRHWHVPPWLKRCGLTYHARAERWPRRGELLSVSRGQEFVCDIGRRSEPRAWLDTIIAAIES